MSDDTSAPRGRYAQPRRRRHAQKGRQRLDHATFEPNQDEGALREPGGYEDDGYAADDAFVDNDAYDEPGAFGDGADRDAPDYKQRYDAPEEQRSTERRFDDDSFDRPSPQPIAGQPDNGFEHDYLGREGARSSFTPEPDSAGRAYAAEDAFAEDQLDAPFTTAAKARDYDSHEFDEPAYERRPLRDRSLPPPPEDAALVSAQDHMAENANLVISGIGKSYKRRPVVRDVSLEVRRGEIVGLLGPNGAGKTTCFYMITGLVPADRGSIRLMGRDLTRLPMYQRARMGLSYLPQEVSIFRGMSVEQNIRAILELSEPSHHRREARLDQLLAEFSISRLRNSPAIALSGGERRRVEIARCLAANPHFILLDEPFAGVDPIAVGDIRSLVWQLKDRGIGVLITDHNVRETLEIIDRAYILHDGRVLMEGAPEDVINDENVRRVYLGEGFRI